MLVDLACNYPITRNEELATKMGVCTRSIIRKAKEMGLSKAFKGSYNFKVWQTVENMYGKYTIKEIAKVASVSERTVCRIINKLNLSMEKDEISIRCSNVQMKMHKSEKRRILFGLEQRTNILVGKSKARRKAKGLLAQHGYITLSSSRIVYYSEDMRRSEHIELYAKSVGLKLELWKTITYSMT